MRVYRLAEKNLKKFEKNSKKVLTDSTPYNIIILALRNRANARNKNGVWLSLARALDLGSRGRRFESCHPDFQLNICGCSSMVEHQPSKLDTWVRFPSPALCVRSSAGQSNGLLSRGSRVRIPPGTLFFMSHGQQLMTFALWWVQHSWSARQIVALKVQGSNPCTHPFFISWAIAKR